MYCHSNPCTRTTVQKRPIRMDIVDNRLKLPALQYRSKIMCASIHVGSSIDAMPTWPTIFTTPIAVWV